MYERFQVRRRFVFGKRFLTTRGKTLYRRTVVFVNRRPMTSFFVALFLLLLLIVLSSFLRRTKSIATQQAPETKIVHVYHVGSVPKVSVQAVVEKSGVVTITALTPGVVQELFVKEGDSVSRGKVLVSLSSNYQGGNVFSTQRQLAERQLQNAEETYNDQKDLIGKQRQQATTTETQSADLRNITNQSIGDTQSSIDLNNDILNSVNKNLDQLNSTNTNGSNDQAILSAKQMKSQFQSANNQLQQSLRSAQYQSDNSKPPADLGRLQRDIAIKQLDLQEKTVTLNRDLSRLQVQLARITEAQMFPSAPFSATVQRVFVKVGQAVNPGTPLVLLSQSAVDDPIVAIAYVPKEVADRVSMMEPTILTLGKTSYESVPSFISSDAIQGTLYGVYYPIPDTFAHTITDHDMITVEIPVGTPDTTAVVPYVPIDAVYQTESSSYIFVLDRGITVAKSVTLGTVYGSYVEVTSGIGDGDTIITDRNVVAGDKVAEGGK